MARPKKRPPPEEVLAWMEEHGKGYKSTSRHFCIPVGTIKGWKRKAKEAAEEAARQPPTPVHAEPHKSATTSGKAGGVKNPPSGGSEEPSKGHRFVPRGSRAVLSAGAMDATARGHLRAAVDRLLTYLSGSLQEPLVSIDELSGTLEMDDGRRKSLEKALGLLEWSPRGAKEASVALGVLIDKCPDILAFEDKLNGNGVGTASGPRGEAAASRLRAALAGGASESQG